MSRKDSLQVLRKRRRKNPLFPLDSDYCLVCGNYSEDRDDENFIIGTNPIIYCSSCHVGVHVKCVGLQEVPESFVCDKCKFLRKGGDPAYLLCAYCPIRYGNPLSCRLIGRRSSRSSIPETTRTSATCSASF